jgi:hypothetical protein
MRRLLVPALVLALTACGGGDDAKAEYVEQATAICADAKQQLDAEQQPAAAAEFAPYVQRVVEIGEQASAELLALEPPEDDRAELEERLLDPLAAQVEAGREFAGKVEAAGDDSAQLLPLLGQVPGTGAIDLDYARDYGLSSCTELLPAP